jgi:hypothetical protein
MSFRRRKRVTLQSLMAERRAWEEFESSANERAYGRYMAEQEAGDAMRDAREAREIREMEERRADGGEPV